MTNREKITYKRLAITTAFVLGALAIPKAEIDADKHYESPAPFYPARDFAVIQGPMATNWETCPAGDVTLPAIIRVSATPDERFGGQ